jgi:hypothetical protein
MAAKMKELEEAHSGITTAATPRQPKVGDWVHFVAKNTPSEAFGVRDDHRAALVAAINYDGSLCLKIVNPLSETFKTVPNATYCDGAEHKPWTWHWTD